MKKVRFRTYKTQGLGRIGIDPVNARLKGSFVEAGQLYERPSIINEDNIVFGRETDVAFAFDKVIKAKYAIMDVYFLEPSHLGSVENPRHFLPEAQPRNRATSESGAEIPRLMAENLRPAEIIGAANAYTGAPIVNRRGEVIQGNGRAYALKLYYKNEPADYKAKYINKISELHYYLGLPVQPRPYRDFQRGFCQLEFDNLFRGKFKKSIGYPVVVRMIDISDEDAIKLGQYKQSDLEAISTRTNEVKSRVNLIDDEKLARVLDTAFSQTDPDDSLSVIIRKTNLLTSLIRN